MRLVCVGDSFTEGMCDEERVDGHHRGWSDRAAQALARQARAGGREGVAYANLAVRGKLLDQVVAEQLPVALGFGPDVLTFHAGPNDVLRRGTDLPDLFRRYDDALGLAASAAGTVVVFTAIPRAGGSGRLAALLAERIGGFNEAVRDAASRHGAVLVDMGAVDVLTDRRLWADDRLHLNPGGHRRVAAAVLEAMGVESPALLGGPPGWWRAPLPPPAPRRRAADLQEDVRWVRSHLVPWIGRRLRGVSSGDGMEPKEPFLRPVG